jgi:hypothetical protein
MKTQTTVTAQQIIDAINSGFAAGGKDEWDAPEFEAARQLTGQAGCCWDFAGWRETRRTIREHGRLGGVWMPQYVTVEGATWDRAEDATVRARFGDDSTAADNWAHEHKQAARWLASDGYLYVDRDLSPDAEPEYYAQEPGAARDNPAKLGPFATVQDAKDAADAADIAGCWHIRMYHRDRWTDIDEYWINEAE